MRIGIMTSIATAIAIGVIVATGGGNPGLANIWVDTTGGTCTYSSTEVAYSDAAACSTLDAAWDTMSNGNTGRIKNGTYGSQKITGDKTAATRIIGESKTGVIISGISECEPVFGGDQALCPQADYFELENVTIQTGAEASVGSSLRVYPSYNNVKLINVDLFGNFPNIYIEGPNFTWDGGSHGENGITPPNLTCNEPSLQPIWLLDGADGATIKNMRMNPKFIQDVSTPFVGQCGEDGFPHLEAIRLESTITGVTIRESWFVENGEYGSGYIFGNSSGATGLRLINNFFGNNEPGTYMQWNGGGPCDIMYAYNSWAEDSDDGNTSSCESSVVWVGNVGPDSVTGCGGTHVKNVWPGSGSCGTDTFTGGAASALGIDANGNLEVGSPAIDAAETPDVSDYCTDTATVNSLDRGGTSRPQGSICDAGADER